MYFYIKIQLFNIFYNLNIFYFYVLYLVKKLIRKIYLVISLRANINIDISGHSTIIGVIR